MKKIKRIFISAIAILVVMILLVIFGLAMIVIQRTMFRAIIAEAAGVTDVTYTPMGVPEINSSFKSWMDYNMITDHASPQWAYIQRWGWCDGNGFMRADGERDLGITDDYYMVALGSYYGTGIGTKYRITTDTGNVFYAVLCEQKADCNTDWLHQYGTDNNDVVEFIIDETRLDRLVMSVGSANVYMPLNGKVASVERIGFEWND